MNRSAWNDHEVSGHVSLDEIADAAEDLLDPDRAAAIDAHLRGCADCRSQADALAAVTARLAAAPRSAMPPSVARALQAAVAGQPAEAGRVVSLAEHRTAKPGLGVFGANLRPRRSRWVRPGLVAAAAAIAAGFGGYVVSASAGLNEPPAISARISTQSLGPQAEALSRLGDLDPHRFSRAWQCAREVTDGRITGLAETTVNDSRALLVYHRLDGVAVVTVVTGCAAGTPTAGPTAPLPR